MSARLGQLAAVRDLPLPALNQAMSRDGYVLIVEPGIESMPPVEILFLNQHGASYPRNLVLVGENSKATIVEHYLGPSAATYLTNAVTEIQVCGGGKLQRYKIQQEAMGASHIATVAGELADNSDFENFDLNLGGALARSEIHLALQGQGARADLNGIYLFGAHSIATIPLMLITCLAPPIVSRTIAEYLTTKPTASSRARLLCARMPRAFQAIS